jgi:hypothetical protein
MSAFVKKQLSLDVRRPGKAPPTFRNDGSGFLPKGLILPQK